LGAETIGTIWQFTTRANVAPNVPSNPMPSNNSPVAGNTILAWSATDPDGQALTSDLYFGTTSPPLLLAGGLTEPTFDVGPLSPNQIYYWRVDLSDGDLASIGPEWVFATVAPGDVDMAGAVTTTDAACAFDLFLGLYACGGALEKGVAGAMDCNEILTPRDARCIHVRALGGGCELCTEPPVSYMPVLTQGPTYQYDDTLVVTIDLAGVPQLRSFSLYVVATSSAQFVGASRRGRTAGWAALKANQILVAGYTTGATGALQKEQFIQLRFRRASIPFSGFVSFFGDDLVNAGQLDLYYAGGSVPVLFSAFDAIADINGVRVNWKLSGDETAESYSLWRWTEATGARTRVVDGRVSGTSGTYRDAKVEPATVYHYDMIVRSTLGNEFVSPVASVTTPGDAGMTLGQNHPNPFNPQTSIPYTLPGGSQTSHVRLFILDVSGGIVRRLVNESQAGGAHTALWNGDDDRGTPVSSGVYFYVLDVEGRRLTKKLVLLK
jgi:hypothetical protein